MGKSRKPKLKKKYIIPLVKRCRNCKKGRVTSHHFECDECRSKKDKEKHRKMAKKTGLRRCKIN